MNVDIHTFMPRSRHFKWKELLYLPRWDIHVYPTDTQYFNLLTLVGKLERVRTYLRVPMTVTSGVRPGKYNSLIGGARGSAHILGMACDFQCEGYSADRVRELLFPKLDDYGLRMEDLPGSNWVHLDTREPGPAGRFFRP